MRHWFFILLMAFALAVSGCSSAPAPAPAATSTPTLMIFADVTEVKPDVPLVSYAPPKPDNLPEEPGVGAYPAKLQEPAPAEMVQAEQIEEKVVTSTKPVGAYARVPILMYHYLSTPPANADKYRKDLSVSPENFEAQLKWMKDNGYTTLRLDDLYNHLANKTPLPPKSVILTFDDGYRDFYENAFPLLKKYGFIATVFIISDYINSGNAGYLTWEMVKELSAAGMSIESHSRSHLDLRNRSYEKLVWEILGPIEAIEAHTGKRPRFFCYPMGYHDEAEIRVLRSAGTLAAVTTAYGKMHTLENAMLWSRVRIHGSTTLAGFASLVGE